jgi:hypothetical protein
MLFACRDRMRIAAAVFLLIHGGAHLVGFLGAWDLASVHSTQATVLDRFVHLGSTGTRLFGVLWLLLALSYAVLAVLVVARAPSCIPLGLAVSSVSLAACLITWPAAKFGIPVNLVVIASLLLAARHTPAYMNGKFSYALKTVAPSTGIASGDPVSESDVAALPEPVRRYLRFMGAVGRPRDWSLRAHFHALFRLKEGAWLPCEALQYDTRASVTRLFYMRLAMNGVLPVIVRDTYSQGKGRMLAKAFDLFTVVDGSGTELDTGELVTYLNDAILMAPSLILGPETTWSSVDGDRNAFDVAFTDRFRTVRARVFIDDHGAPTNFSTKDRFFDAPDGRRVQTEWNTPIEGWQLSNGRHLPTRGRAVWMLPSGPFAYGDFRFDPERIEFNVAAGS